CFVQLSIWVFNRVTIRNESLFFAFIVKRFRVFRAPLHWSLCDVSNPLGSLIFRLRIISDP
ncbi:hypothetical protein ACT7DP_31270, partial [Bacillus paranthracis]